MKRGPSLHASSLNNSSESDRTEKIARIIATGLDKNLSPLDIAAAILASVPDQGEAVAWMPLPHPPAPHVQTPQVSETEEAEAHRVVTQAQTWHDSGLKQSLDGDYKSAARSMAQAYFTLLNYIASKYTRPLRSRSQEVKDER